MKREDVKRCCLYMRYSDASQSEQSIEGQMRVCKEFCERQGITVVESYIDRALSARSAEHRTEFLRMIANSTKHNWDAVVVYKLDRFARNRNDSANYKAKLKRNNVIVISATENLSDNPESIILESLLEGMAEYYSAELAQKINRGLHESAMKCNQVGGHVPLGYKIINKKLVIDPITAPIVKEAFERYAAGERVSDICAEFNSRGLRTSKHTEFNRSSFTSMFKNEKYKGVYKYKDIKTPGGVPAIVSEELFDEVARKITRVSEAPARGKAKMEYILSGKIFCGHCGATMIGESGTSRNGTVHNYYTCLNRKNNKGVSKCDKKPIPKDYIEEIVARDAMSMLQEDVIEYIADMAVKQAEDDIIQTTRLPELTAKKSEVEKSISNITKMIERGAESDSLIDRINALEAEKKSLFVQITQEERYVYHIDKAQVIDWFHRFLQGDIHDEKFKKHLIDMLVNSVTVWDDPDGYKITTAYNLTDCASKTYRVPVSNTGTALGERFGFDTLNSTIGRISEPLYIVGLVFVQTKRHPLP